MSYSFYAVKAGRKPGVYTSWDECSKQVTGFNKAQFKGFNNREDAEDYVAGKNLSSTHQATSKAKSSQKTVSLKEPYAFVDGSYNEATSTYGYGGFLCVCGKRIPIQGSGSAPNDAAARNVTGEIHGAMAAVKLAEKMGLKELHMLYDYQGIEGWATGKWKRNLDMTREYHDFMTSPDRTVSVNFQKVAAHTGIEGNELADIMAKDACGVDLTKPQKEKVEKLKNSQTLSEKLNVAGLVNQPVMDTDSIVVFDVETADKYHNRICQIGIVEIQPEEPYNVISKVNMMIDPECEFGFYNTKVHGISEADVAGAPNFKQAWDSTLSKYFTENKRVVGHGLKFDMSALNKCCQAYDIEFPTTRVCDTHTMAKHYKPQSKKNGLEVVASWFGYELSDDAHHDALNDAEATAAAFIGLKRNMSVSIPFTTKSPMNVKLSDTRIKSDKVEQMSFDDLEETKNF